VGAVAVQGAQHLNDQADVAQELQALMAAGHLDEGWRWYLEIAAVPRRGRRSSPGPGPSTCSTTAPATRAAQVEKFEAEKPVG
jgi:hypothetical protein